MDLQGSFQEPHVEVGSQLDLWTTAALSDLDKEIDRLAEDTYRVFPTAESPTKSARSQDVELQEQLRLEQPLDLSSMGLDDFDLTDISRVEHKATEARSRSPVRFGEPAWPQESAFGRDYSLRDQDDLMNFSSPSLNGGGSPRFPTVARERTQRGEAELSFGLTFDVPSPFGTEPPSGQRSRKSSAKPDADNTYLGPMEFPTFDDHVESLLNREIHRTESILKGTEGFDDVDPNDDRFWAQVAAESQDDGPNVSLKDQQRPTTTYLPPTPDRPPSRSYSRTSSRQILPDLETNPSDQRNVYRRHTPQPEAASDYPPLDEVPGMSAETASSIDLVGPTNRETDEMDSRAVVNALRMLQDRVDNLEGEKVAAKKKISDLEEELAKARRLLMSREQSLASASSRTKSEPPLQNIPAGRDHSPYFDLEDDVARIHAESERLEDELNFSMNIERVVDQELARIEKAKKEVEELRRELSKPELGSTAPQSNNVGSSRKANSPERPNKNSRNTSPARNIRPIVGASQEKADDSFLHPDEVQRLQEDVHQQRVAGVGRKMAPKTDEHARIKESLFQKIKSQGGIQRPLRNRSPMKKASTAAGTRRTLRPASPEWKKMDGRVSDRVRPDSAPRPRGRTKAATPKNLLHQPQSDGTQHNHAHARDSRTNRDIGSVKDLSAGREIPFIVGKSTGKSHSVTANLQRLRSRSAERSGAPSPIQKNNSTQREAWGPTPGPIPNHPDDTNNQSHIDDNHISFHTQLEDAAREESGPTNIRNVLGILENDHKELKKQYMSLVRQYEQIMSDRRASLSGANDTDLRNTGDDLRDVIRQMELKREQILILREILHSSIHHEKSHRRTLTTTRDTKRSLSPFKKPPTQARSARSTSGQRGRRTDKPSSRPAWGAPPAPHSHNHNNPNSRTRPCAPCEHRKAELKEHREEGAKVVRSSRSRSPGLALASLNLLRSSLKVQEALEEAKGAVL
ncbi:hypothetical protein HDV00_003597 [Rhizophlyctis rosea]|nr:hypothetical protein HDV00_003597 [Rhizophlyctis rosea]